ncbi:MAG: hypothetical protein IJB79_07590 [Candidatus Gastranaerophilales bacterium]|nr:hypothetical protein [Candidatus Gastranaerophilales bacterium]
MANKCRGCGFEYNDEDIFCSRCGIRLSDDKKNDINSSLEQFGQSVFGVSNNNGLKFKHTKTFDNMAIGTGLFLIVMLCALCISLFHILNSHQDQKEVLQFKNLIENPSQIPLLKEPMSFEEFAKNIKQVEDFLHLYFENSSDSQDKKEQIFASYLKELEKLPNVLNLKIQEIPSCQNLKNSSSCLPLISKKFEDTSVSVFSGGDFIFLYPNYDFIKKKYGEFLRDDFKKYVNLRLKYNYPSSIGLDLKIKPNKLADKIFDYEKLYQTTQNEFIKEELEQQLYYDFRKFIFTPSIYATTTQEMRDEFKKAYEYFIKTKKTSNFRPLIMSYLDKKRAYGEENFKNDYPYKIFSLENFNDNVKNSVLNDVFVQLRKNIFTNKNIDLPLSFVYDIKNGKWARYDSSHTLSSGEFVISEPDENNNISIYNNMFSPMQELNILKYSKLYLISDGLYVFNQDKLSISKVTFNGKTFNLYTLNHVDISSLFPGIEVINLDTIQSYNVLVEKDNARANYIIMSRYSQGWNDYSLDVSKGEINKLTLPNMFSINSTSDVVILFRDNQDLVEQFRENKPTYKFTIHTRGHKEPVDDKEKYAQYDEKTQEDEENEKNLHKPNIMPKLRGNEEVVELENIDLLEVPQQEIEPPNE